LKNKKIMVYDEILNGLFEKCMSFHITLIANEKLRKEI